MRCSFYSILFGLLSASLFFYLVCFQDHRSNNVCNLFCCIYIAFHNDVKTFSVSQKHFLVIKRYPQRSENKSPINFSFFYFKYSISNLFFLLLIIINFFYLLCLLMGPSLLNYLSLRFFLII